ncbi:glycosyltransferase family 4 protein [Erwinia sp. V71]|uniref:glycosyltransferase family 4 protein n=1 Tax=Erwinia sp. V71 TaxID=3369424 RepID=UPI003F636E84
MPTKCPNKNIVFLVDDYIPDSTKVAAKMMHEMAVELVQRNINVIVVTPSETLNSQFHHEFIDGVEIIRFKLGPIKNCYLALRAINETLLPFKAFFNTWGFFMNKEIDLIVSYSPSIFWGRFTRKLKERFSCPVYLILRDFFPQWIIDNGMIKSNSLVAKYFRYIERLNYQSADVIGIQSLANIEFFKQYFGNNYPTRLLYNWASPVVDDENIGFKKRLGIEDKTLFFYGGNIGKAQDMANLVRLAQNLLHKPQAHFVFLGQGDEVELVKYMAKKNNIYNLSLLPPVSQQEFKSILKEVDVGLFSLSRDHESHNFPGKILGYMVNQIPILGSVNVGNDLQSIIKEYEAGLVTVNGEDDLLLQNALSLLENPRLRRQSGINAERLLHAKFTVSAAADEVLSIL